LALTRLRLSAAVALFAPGLLVTCGSLPTQADHPSSHAQPPSLDGPLARIAHDSTPAPSRSGFRLMAGGYYSLDARIELVRRARELLQREENAQGYELTNFYP